MTNTDILQELLNKIEKTLAFLDKVKLDKSSKKEKDALASDLRNCAERCSQAFKLSNPTAGEIYDDTIQQDDHYDDNVPMQCSDTYDDNMLTSSAPPPIVTEIMPKECEQLTNYAKAEMLELKSKGFFSGWVKRWCVLHGGILYLYETAKDKKQKDAFIIQNMTFEVRDDLTKETKRKGRCFELKTGDGAKAYQLCAVDKDSVDKWHQTLNLRQGSHRASSTSLNKLDATGQESYDDVVAPKAIEHSKSKIGGFLNILPKKSRPSVRTSGSAENALQQDDEYDDTADNGNKNIAPSDELYEEYEEEEAKTLPPLPPTPTQSNAPGRRFSERSTGSGAEPPSLPSRSNGSTVRPLPSPDGGKERAQMPLPPAPNTGPERIHTPLPPAPISTPTPSDLPPPPLDMVNLPESPMKTKDLPPPPPSNDNVNKAEDYANHFQGMWDCEGNECELSFKRGEVIYILSKEFDEYGWWVAEKDEHIGLVPKNYLMEAYAI